MIFILTFVFHASMLVWVARFVITDIQAFLSLARSWSNFLSFRSLLIISLRFRRFPSEKTTTNPEGSAITRPSTLPFFPDAQILFLNKSGRSLSFASYHTWFARSTSWTPCVLGLNFFYEFLRRFLSCECAFMLYILSQGSCLV